MKIEFKTVRYKNLLSSGNSWTTIPLNNNRTTLISGTNGSGKSTLLDAIVFGLYGKAFRKINKNQLINSINGRDTLVEIEFQIGQNKYMVRRGIKPVVFEIWKNGEVINQDAASRDYQSYLEQNILNLNYKSFNQNEKTNDFIIAIFIIFKHWGNDWSRNSFAVNRFEVFVRCQID